MEKSGKCVFEFMWEPCLLLKVRICSPLEGFSPWGSRGYYSKVAVLLI